MPGHGRNRGRPHRFRRPPRFKRKKSLPHPCACATNLVFVPLRLQIGPKCQKKSKFPTAGALAIDTISICCVCTRASCFGVGAVGCLAVDPDDMTRNIAFTGRVHYMIMQERAYLECFLKCPMATRATPQKGFLEGHFMFCPGGHGAF